MEVQRQNVRFYFCFGCSHHKAIKWHREKVVAVDLAHECIMMDPEKIKLKNYTHCWSTRVSRTVWVKYECCLKTLNLFRRWSWRILPKLFRELAVNGKTQLGPRLFPIFGINGNFVRRFKINSNQTQIKLKLELRLESCHNGNAEYWGPFRLNPAIIVSHRNCPSLRTTKP